MHDIGDRLVAAIAAGDVEGVRAIYAPDATIWHNFDQRDQSPDENLLTLVDLHRRASNLQYTEIRRFVESAEARAQFAAQGIELEAGSPADLQARVMRDRATWSTVVRKAGITVEPI